MPERMEVDLVGKPGPPPVAEEALARVFLAERAAARARENESVATPTGTTSLQSSQRLHCCSCQRDDAIAAALRPRRRPVPDGEPLAVEVNVTPAERREFAGGRCRRRR